jgi:hypothetical protein
MPPTMQRIEASMTRKPIPCVVHRDTGRFLERLMAPLLLFLSAYEKQVKSASWYNLHS